MAGFADLLGALVQNGLPKSGTTRAGEMFGGGGALQDIVGSLGNILEGSGSRGQSGGFGGILGEIVSSLGDNKAALGGIGALGGALLGGGNKSAKGAIGGGALAMLAGLAISALKNAGKQPDRTPNALMANPASDVTDEMENDANILVCAMINAAKADGTIDRQEIEKIAGKLEENGLSQEEKDFFISESEKPFDLHRVVTSAGGREELGAQIYAASLLAIEVDTKAEQLYLKSLANGLGLDAQTVRYIENSLGV